MSAPAFAWAIEVGANLRLKPADRLVLIYLADKANGERVCWPGQETIEKFTGLAPNTVRQALNRLAVIPLIRVETRPGYSSRYTILRDTPANGAHPTPAECAQVAPPNGAQVGGHDLPGGVGTFRPGGGHDLRQPPPNGAHEPSTNQEKKTLSPRAHAREESEVQNSLEKGSEAQPPPASPPKAPLLDATGGGVSTFRPPEPASDDPAIRRLIGGLVRSMQNNHPPRAARRSPSEQIEELDGEVLPPIRRGPVDPVRTVAEQIAWLQEHAA